MHMDPTYIVKKPLVTEKSTWESTERNRYTFEVNLKAGKPQIKAAVEALYGVRVDRVTTQVRKGKYFRTKFGPGKTSNWKKAVVYIHAEDTIELF